uniref:Uncharacterized protein n=1 Tax=viral metagenome TaxID=1070528 RepID=A0A6C0J833_9ZZZZ
MKFSRIVLVLSLAVLALVLFNTLSNNDNSYENYENIDLNEPFDDTLPELLNDDIAEEDRLKEDRLKTVMREKIEREEREKREQEKRAEAYAKRKAFEAEAAEKQNNIVKNQPVKSKFVPNDNEIDGALLTEEINLTPADVDSKLIDGTENLMAPLATRFQSVNSISNVNRNSSNDLRGDIEIQYDDKYTPFYASHIYGEPLHQNNL